MSYIFPDEVRIFNITRDVIHKIETEINNYLSDAYIEDEDKVAKSTQGNVVTPRTLIFLPNTATNINKGDYIQITRIKNIVITSDMQLGIKRKVTKVGLAGGTSLSHLEVECTSGN